MEHSESETVNILSSELNFTIAGKTGSSQVFAVKDNKDMSDEMLDFKLKDHSIYIGFAPVNNPELAVSVVIEQGGSSGAIAKNVGIKVIEKYFLK